MKKPVLVLGGGIAGIQTSLDLAEMGVPVFLVEESPSIGGRMAQLDKTFPTNDCSACILAPKVTECFNHPLVKTLSYSELIELSGDAPSFNAKIRRKARYIDEEKCKGCGDCTEKCPIAEKSEFDMKTGDRKAVYKPFAQAVPNKVAIDKKGTSPCKYTCPAHIHAHGYVALAGQERFEEALALVREKTPFAGVLGRVCLHPCENECSRKYVDDSVPIASIKRFLADKELEENRKPEIKMTGEKKDEKVAIIGAGPAGLNCAYQLAREGYSVTVFESLPKAGGMLRYGIPDYRLDKSILDYEIKIVEDLGVEIKTNVLLGKDVTIDSLKKDGFKAVYVAIGAHKDLKLGIDGENADGVISSVDFLREVNMGNRNSIGKKVLVVGGGNVAMDAARTALRLGSDVTVVYRRSREQMPANIWEIEHAEEEGVKFDLLSSPVEVISKNNKVTALKCLKNELGELDRSGRRRPVPVKDSEFEIEADTIIIAIGQTVHDEPVKKVKQICFDRWGTIECNDDNTTTEHDGIFSGGDCVTGPATMIEAIAAGNKAANAIQNYIEGTDKKLEPDMLPKTEIEDINLKVSNKSGRGNMPMIGMDKRKNTFDEVELGFSEEDIIREANRCVDCSVCSECMACVSACQAEAICHMQQEEIIDIDIGAVIVCAGFDTSKEISQHFGYNDSKDVVTSMEYERILSASGPFQGHVQRPSDGRAPKKIAFIQCVGSRDFKCDVEYCSAVCCMYATKEAMITKEHLPSVEDIDIYYMDIRAYGKDFDKYIESAKTKYGINFIKSRISDVEVTGEEKNLKVNYVGASGKPASDIYDMVVLSVGLDAKGKVAELLKKTSVKTDKYGFCWTSEFNPTASSRDGIFTCGVTAGPKDIPETVIEASAAAAGASKIVNDSTISDELYNKYFIEEPLPPFRDVSNEPVRMGVFVCHCGVNIGGYLSVDEIVEYAKELPYVVYADQNLYTCSVDAQKVIIEKIKEYNLNRVVVASCTPRTHEPLFQDVLKRAGLNPYLFSMANIRDQCSWVHMDNPEDATEKAKDLVQMAISKGVYSKQLERQKIDVTKSALIVGGGMSGLSAALEIASMGYKVSIVEKTGELGGNAKKIYRSPKGRLYSYYIDEYIKRAEENKNIDIYMNSEIKELDGYVGKFTTVIKTPGKDVEIKHGVVIVAIGASEYKPVEYLYGKDPDVITQLELESKLSNKEISNDIKDIIMLQCVGSRTDERPYCSRVCCNQAIKNAIILKEENPERSITMLYKDIRSYGFSEAEYKKARQLGVKFIRYTDDKLPEALNKEGLQVKVYDEILEDEIMLKADMLILASAIIPNVDANKKLAQMLKVPTNDEGFFLEAHVKLRPVDFATDGVFVCGLAHSPKNLRESIVQGRAAAARAATVISKDTLEAEGTIAKVNEALCEACGECEKVCAYKAITIEEKEHRGRKYKVSSINPALCKGCGTCASTCRCGAIDVKGFLDVQVLSELASLLKTNT
jgi:heterodisulfide reductase subunit A-like polyferredoxin